MQLNTVSVVSIMIGAVLLYSAVKANDPRNVVLEALGQKPRFPLFSTGVIKPIQPSAADGGGGGIPRFTSANDALGNATPL